MKTLKLLLDTVCVVSVAAVCLAFPKATKRIQGDVRRELNALEVRIACLRVS